MHYLESDVHQKWEELLINPCSDHFLSYSSSVWFRYVLSVNIGTALPSFYAKENIDFQIYWLNISRVSKTKVMGKKQRKWAGNMGGGGKEEKLETVAAIKPPAILLVG